MKPEFYIASESASQHLSSTSIFNTVLSDWMPDIVQTSILDPDRLSPILAGASFIRSKGGRATVVVRTAADDIQIEASSALLTQVFKWCDGTRTINEVLSNIGNGETRAEFADFLKFLLAQGVLIDANLACAHAASYGFQFSPFGLAASSHITNQICRRFLWNGNQQSALLPLGTVKVQEAPLDSFFAARVTSYTFNDKTISSSSLHQLLWSLAGVVSVKHPRAGYVTPQRTLASAGGMHLVEVYVALQRHIDTYAPGIYRVQYPDEHAIFLQPVSQSQDMLPLAFGKPWELTYATGAIFLAADPVVAAMRYRSRSLQYLFMEAGAALHNGALSADALGLGYATIGGYYEQPISRMCMLDRQILLGSAIFGAKPTEEQVGLIARTPDIEFAWVNGESAQYTMGFHLARAQVVTQDNDRPYTWGRSADPRVAVRKAVAEAVEREGFREPRGIVQGNLVEIAGALDPRLFVRYSKSQYLTPDFFYKPFSNEQSYPWVAATDMVTGKQVRVLGELVFSRTSLNALGHVTLHPYTQVTSSGCAASTTISDACCRALLEVVERDAFMRHWLAQKPGKLILSKHWPREINQRVEAMQAVGCNVTIQHLTVPWAQVALVSVQHHEQHFTTMGTAASFDFAQAVNCALDEVEARVYAWIHGHLPSIKRHNDVVTTEHHFELYGLKQYYKRANRVLFPAVPDIGSHWPHDLGEITLDILIENFAAAKLHPISLDITPQQCYVDQGRTRLSVVKALVPSLLPISFGYQREPLGMASRIHSGSKFPHPFP